MAPNRLKPEHSDHDPGGDRAPRPPTKPARRAPSVAAKHRHQDELLDEGVEETFPASDPVSVKKII